ncbi:MAG: flagellin, partial [Alphaproteobacteria bacterium]|nr:flagellin [Alphaproteobacteria bacterium]
MGMSVNTNVGAMVALQNLSSTQDTLRTTQNRIATGLAVAGAKDDSATYAIAQKLRGDIGGLKAVTASLNRAKSTVDVALSGAQQVSDILNQMKEKATAAADDGLDQDSRDAINEDFKALRDQITSIVNSATFNGTNLLDGGSGSVAALKSLQDGDGATAGYQTDSLSVANQDLKLGTGTAAGTN